MGVAYETMRLFIWKHGWRTVPMLEGEFTVVGWENEKNDLFCQDIAEAYAVTNLRVRCDRWKI